MQQSSSLPEPNLHLDGTPKLLKTIQQLRSELWLESSLNQLQSSLNSCLLSVSTTMPQATTTEAEIFQTVVNELHQALSASRVGIAVFLPQATVGKMSYISCSPSLSSRNPILEAIFTNGEKQRLKLQDGVRLEDLQQLEKQQPPIAYPLIEDVNGVIYWLIIARKTHKSEYKSPHILPDTLQLELIKRTSYHCSQAIAQLRQIQSWQQRVQELATFNQELERTNQLKNQFLANTSHEIRTPLSSIIGFTHLLLAQGYDPDKQRHQEYLTIIQSSSKHLLALINDILDLSKIEANQLEVQWEIVDVPSLCRNVFALVKEKAANKGLKLRLELDPDVKTLVADPLRLKQMLLNLLFNAVKFTIKGSVGLQVSTKEQFLAFTIWDTGTGISAENQALLFRPYCQIVNSAVSRDEGTGLGLVVTQKLAEIHGGCLKLESEINQGSRFTIFLPLQQKEEVLTTLEVKPAADLEVGETANLSINYPAKILLIEDDLPNGKLMEIYLSKLGYQVTWVKNADQMWKILEKIEPIVILLDVNLPAMNGLKLVEQLRKNPKYQKIPIIAQTAMAMKGDRETCLAAGVNDYISKPLDLPLLANLVAKYSKPLTVDEDKIKSE
ncbi:hybrid histidine kinase/response regulator HrmK [Cronbergia sp. UHCC 0137]|uniref:hybrid histidine kinase/response regulator HrmK n=1 Tax=Cronbergia sp. UHCC 0137 TaxID=3110239 RepID=UPI002B214268|nr:hybrid histidine kinase/response regulator HrmK [Cronbergia sp. UHCC 0137]MEA5620337.1 hybrid histidine kinase/response regulator HrmK [Cronbergia sp. UHCC 0137]